MNLFGSRPPKTDPQAAPKADPQTPGNPAKRPPPARTEIAVFGDSHATYFFPSPFFVGRLGLAMPLKYFIVGESIPAASVAGFRPGVSTLQVKEKILEALPTSERMILAFGQVDLELGYYFRLVMKGESLTPDSYVDWLVGIYTDFVASLPAGDCAIALKGVNLTALAPHPFAVRYVARIVTEGSELTEQEGSAKVAPFVLSEDEQNRMHLRFNAALRAFALQSGYGYFDLVSQTGDGGVAGLTNRPIRLDDHYRVARLDHHLADTVPVRRMHYEAAGRAFDLI